MLQQHTEQPPVVVCREPGIFQLVAHKPELELIQTHMTQKPVLRVEAGARALRMLVKNMCG